MTFEKSRYFIYGSLTLYIANEINKAFLEVYNYTLPIETIIIIIALILFLIDYKDFNKYKKNGGK